MNTTNNSTQSNANDTVNEKNWSEEFEVAGNQLMEKVQELIAEGNARRIIVRKSNGETMIDVPLTAGVAAGAVALLIPGLRALVIIGSIAAFAVQKFKVEVIRDETDEVVDADVQQIKVEVADGDI